MLEANAFAEFSPSDSRGQAYRWRDGFTCPAQRRKFANERQSFRITVARVHSGGPKNIPHSRCFCVLPIDDLTGLAGAGIGFDNDKPSNEFAALAGEFNGLFSVRGSGR